MCHQVDRIGPEHQAGSDALLTAAAFFKLQATHFNGRIDRPSLANRVLSPAEVAACAGDSLPSGLEQAVVAAWDFSRGIAGETLHDAGPNRLHGLLIMGSEDPHQFAATQGTDLLAFFGGVFERSMRRWLS